MKPQFELSTTRCLPYVELALFERIDRVWSFLIQRYGRGERTLAASWTFNRRRDDE
ncbi:hypothetical protein [Halogeometricum luteum]|uniref:Transposase n=1 Tax=Halogeometricum luteum TaxID=2950537 RepID=A0ABU2G3P7_9EURY|nr:hypothetical protein [Halogeometricum sp. S3BR5-2]MDS0295420.1 hypothetical protein [Halogeometricum sp. S3BR5-2]